MSQTSGTEIAGNASGVAGAAPVSSGDRMSSLDVLRGFALLGILVMNIQSFSMISSAYMNPTAYGDLTGANWWVWTLSHLLTDQKMYGIFSMLFGAGLVLMTQRAEERSGTSRAIHFRRMWWLLLFGVLHAHLLWYGDILFAYAVCGMIVYRFRHHSPRRLMVLAGVFFTIGSVLYLLFGWSMPHWGAEAIADFSSDAWRPTAEMVQSELATYRGGWLTQLSKRSEEAFLMETVFFLVAIVWKTIGNMLLGMALYKTGVLTGRHSRTFYARLATTGLVVGLSLVTLGIWRNFSVGWTPQYSFFFGSQFNYWGAIAVDMGWIGLVMLLCASPNFRRIKAWLSAVGRTALSNYILQTVIATTLFYGHGFGLFGSVSRVGQMGMCVAIWVTQISLSTWWITRFEYGPLEWLWRSLTYKQRMPMRRALVRPA